MRLAHASLSSAGDTINTGDFTPKENLKIIAHLPSDGNLDNCKLFVGTGGSIDTGSNYTFRHSTNGAGDGTNTSMSGYWFTVTNLDADVMLDANIVNKADKEKLIQSHSLLAASGAGTAPQRSEIVGKWTNKTGQINTIRITNSGTGDFEAGSYITVLGASGDVSTDEKATLTNVPNNSRYEETDTRKIYRRIVGNTTTTVGLETSDWTATRSSSPYVASDGTELVYTIYNHSSTAGSAIYDLGSALSDTKWVARIHINNTTTNNDGAIMIQFTNTGGNILTTANADRIYCLLYKNSGQGLNIMARTNGEKNFWSDGAGVAELYSAGDTGVTTGDCYIEITRQSTTTGVIKVGSNSDYTSNTSYTISDLPADVSGLRYIQIGNSNHGTGGTGYTLIGSVKSIKVQDGVDSFIESGWKERGTA